MHLRLSALVCFLLLASFLYSQEDSDSYAIEDSMAVDLDIFAIEQPASITLKYDMKEFRKRQPDDEYIDAELIYHMSDSSDDRHRYVRLKARGKNRQEVCTFPPIWINIRKSGLDNKYLEGTTRMKLVTHCGSSGSYQAYVLKEYLVYKIYEMISDYSFRVRLVRMKYIDTSRKKNREMERWAFLIEPEAMLAERLDMLPIKNDRVGMMMTDTGWTNRMTMFQYMIGNADYSIAGRHNVKLLRDGDHLNFNIFPVPYDFDYAGLVNAHYAIPGDNLGISSVTERYFLGPCRNQEDYLEVIDELVSKKESIFELIRDFEYLSEKERDIMNNYLEEFFDVSGDPRFIEREITSTCR